MTAKKKTARKTPPSTKPAPKKKAAARPRAAPVDPARAEAAGEVLQAVWLSEKHFDLESELVLQGGAPVVDEDAEGHLWVTVKLHVPALDVDMWLDGTHTDHPDNQDEPDDEAS